MSANNHANGNNTPLGIMDSGSGGLSIWQSVVSLLPHESIIYVGDHAHLPYSQKTTQTIRRRASAVIQFLQTRGVKLVIVACNTATVAGIETYRRRFPKLAIIGVVPLVKTAAQTTRTRRFAVLSTAYTAASGYQKQLIRAFASDCVVYNLGLTDLVQKVEQGIVWGPAVRRRLHHTLAPLRDKNIDVIALGCTHFPFLRRQIQLLMGKKVTVLDSGGAVARHAKRVLTQNSSLAHKRPPKYEFFTTGNPRQVGRVASGLLRRSIRVTYVPI